MSSKSLVILLTFQLHFRELVENIYAPKSRRLSPKETEELMLVVINKDKDLRTTLEVKSL
jgi:hypothetical protein